jgi:hypothetical protein
VPIKPKPKAHTGDCRKHPSVIEIEFHPALSSLCEQWIGSPGGRASIRSELGLAQQFRDANATGVFLTDTLSTNQYTLILDPTREHFLNRFSTGNLAILVLVLESKII